MIVKTFSRAFNVDADVSWARTWSTCSHCCHCSHTGACNIMQVWKIQKPNAQMGMSTSQRGRWPEQVENNQSTHGRRLAQNCEWQLTASTWSLLFNVSSASFNIAHDLLAGSAWAKRSQSKSKMEPSATVSIRWSVDQLEYLLALLHWPMREASEVHPYSLGSTKPRGTMLQVLSRVLCRHSDVPWYPWYWTSRQKNGTARNRILFAQYTAEGMVQLAGY